MAAAADRSRRGDSHTLDTRHAPMATAERTDPALARFLREHPHLRPLLRQAQAAVDRHFGPGTPITFEVVADPEEGDQALFAFVQTDLDPDLALERLSRLDEEWWLAAIPESRGDFQIDVRCR